MPKDDDHFWTANSWTCEPWLASLLPTLLTVDLLLDGHRIRPCEGSMSLESTRNIDRSACKYMYIFGRTCILNAATCKGTAMSLDLLPSPKNLHVFRFLIHSVPPWPTWPHWYLPMPEHQVHGNKWGAPSSSYFITFMALFIILPIYTSPS